MAHAAPPPPSRQRRSAIIGAFLLIVGLVVAGIAVYGLNKPKGHQASKDTGTATVVATSAKPSTTTSSAKPSTSTASVAPTTAKSSATTTKVTTTAPSSATSTTPSASPFAVVVVNNNPDDVGIASAAAQEFKAKGWTISGDPANWGDENAILSNCAYYDPDVTGTEAAAEKLQSEFPGIDRVEPKFEGLPDGPIVVALINSIDG